MRTLLHCGHSIPNHERLMLQWYSCPQCGTDVKPAAFECREWKVTCGTHRQGRWFGQDRESARLWKHAKCQGATVDYLQLEWLRKTIRSVYGRKVRTIIEDVTTARSWPEKRSFQVLILDSKLADISDSDEPPF